MKIFNYRITIEKIKKSRKVDNSRARTHKHWTDSEKDTLMRFINEGKTYEEIAVLLLRSKPAIQVQLSKIRRSNEDRRSFNKNDQDTERSLPIESSINSRFAKARRGQSDSQETAEIAKVV